MPPHRRRIHLRGAVQGVGFRPLAVRLARQHGLTGAVWNDPSGAVVEVQGEGAEIEAFLVDLRAAPRPVFVTELHSQTLDVFFGETAFTIAPSRSDGGAAPALPADLGVCADCLAEIFDPTDRRYRYPFTSCTRCGPRYTLASTLPFDRARTAMAAFPLCADCAWEYADPTDRRFHAQAICCPRCGPRICFQTVDGILGEGEAALRFLLDSLQRGAIGAIKGLGGFQLFCDARDEAAVRRLRDRKGRPERPLAVMLASLTAAGQRATLGAEEEKALCGPEMPIVLVPLRVDHDLAPSVTCGLSQLGVMLPTTPLHALILADFGGPLVCTSGNRTGEPLSATCEQARASLTDVADVFLDHDRPILRTVDDSVLRLDAGVPLLLRRARGFAPVSWPMAEGPAVLALGAHQKNTVALAWGGQIVVSPHIGDLGEVQTRARMAETAQDLCDFYGVRPQILACDLHPDSAASQHAEALAATWEIPLVAVQHHHAHAAAVLAEHGREGPVLALCWDGVGFGADGTLWGGEALIASAADFRRFACLRPFPLPGGERASREPARAALGLLHGWGLPVPAFVEDRLAESLGRASLPLLRQAMDRGVAAPQTSAIGRLFDAVAFLLGGPGRCSYEAQAAMGLEALAGASKPLSPSEGFSPSPPGRGWPNGPGEGARAGTALLSDGAPMIASLLADLAAGISPSLLAARFHASLAALALDLARAASLPTVVLAGGCFQNALLTRLTREALLHAGFEVLLPAAFPPNDGAISLGQVLVARARHRAGLPPR